MVNALAVKLKDFKIYINSLQQREQIPLDTTMLK